ncbi:MAG: NUDIX hydrolase [Candidatus Nanoarchaeia archaeon]|nr:NUDIX hydrolase [Candidatus Nanoarchaeia archaeon]
MDKKYGPWIIKGTKEIYRNKWISLREDSVLTKNNTPEIYASLTAKPGIGVLAIDKDNYCHVVKEFKYGVGKEIIGLVTGGVEKNEKPIETAKRELKEELGIEADEWTYLGIEDPFTAYVNCPHSLFLARKLKFTENNLEDFESLTPLKIKFDELVSKIVNNEITDSHIITVVFKVKELLNRESKNL